MSAVFPILKRDGSAYANLTEFKQDLNHSTSGRYILSAGHGWHGGVHLNSQSFPWGKGLRSIQAMLGGKVAAYRINDDYVSSEYMGKTFKFSNNFVLLEHEYADPTEGSDKVFTFYTLYMHLAPPKHIAANAEHHSRYRIEDAKGINTRVLENGQFKSPVALPTGSEFEYLDVDNQTFKTAKIGSTEYAMIRCRVLSDTSGSQTLLNKEVWIASGKHEEADFALLTQSGYIVPVPSPEPAWMTGSEIKRDGSVVAIKKPDGEDTRINIDAGSDLGYLSLNEFSQDSNATKQDEYVVHIEMFSIDKPEEYFLKQFENINQAPVDGTASEGAVAPGNSLFEQLITLTGEEGDAPTTLMTTEALVRRLDSRRKKFENLIVQHKSEWYQESATQMIDTICDVAIGVMDNTFSRSFTNDDMYHSSDWRADQLTAFDVFSAHQKERSELLSWVQDASDIITADPKPYYFWPLKAALADDEMNESWLTVPKGSLTFNAEGNDIVGSPFFTRKPHIPHNGDIVIGESGITIGRGLDIGKRTSFEVENIFSQASENCRAIPSDLLDWLKDGAKKIKQPALNYWKTLDRDVSSSEQMITRKMQHYLFLTIYDEYVKKAKDLTTRKSVCDAYLGGKKIDWDSLSDSVKDVIVDLLYVGVYTGKSDSRANSREKIIPAIYKDQIEGKSGIDSNFYNVMKDENFWKVTFSVAQARFDSRLEELV